VPLTMPEIQLIMPISTLFGLLLFKLGGDFLFVFMVPVRRHSSRRRRGRRW